jgi:dienelactone hydrolase
LVAAAKPCEAQVRQTVVDYPSGETRVGLDCFVPKGAKGLPAVIVLHGSGGMAEGSAEVFRRIAGSIARRGYVVLLPHFFDKTDHAVGAPLATGEYEAMFASLKDLVAFAAQQPEIDVNKLAVVGFSMGSNLAKLMATSDPRIKAVALWSGAYPPIPPSKKLPPLLIIHGANDDDGDLTLVNRFQAGLKAQNQPFEAHIYPGVGHNLDSRKIDDASVRSAAFFDKYLKEKKGDKPQAKKAP